MAERGFIMLRSEYQITTLVTKKEGLRIARKLQKLGLIKWGGDKVEPTKEPAVLTIITDIENKRRFWLDTDYNSVIDCIQNCNSKLVANENREKYVFVSNVHRQIIRKRGFIAGDKYWVWKMNVLR